MWSGASFWEHRCCGSKSRELSRVHLHARVIAKQSPACVPVVQVVQAFCAPQAAMPASEADKERLRRVVTLSFFGYTIDSICRDGQLQALQRDLDIAEIFSTAKSLVTYGEQSGLTGRGFDWKSGDASVTTQTGFLSALRLVMRLKVGGLLMVAPDCSSFVFACSSLTGRSAGCPQGRHDYLPVQQGISADVVSHSYPPLSFAWP